MEHGVTFGDSSEDVFALNGPIAGQMKEASVKGTQMVLRSAIGYAAVSRSAKEGDAAFKNATKFLVQNMLRSMTKKLEIMLMYGQVGYGTVAAATGPVVEISVAEWAPGIWAGSEKMPIEIRNAAGNTSRGTANIVSVDFETKELTLDATIPGVVATDVIWHLGAYGKECAGIHKILTNNSTIFGIDASVYSLFKGNVYSAGSAALSFNKVQDAIARAVEKGLESDVSVICNPKTWADLLNEQAALRMYDQTYSTEVSQNGAKTIKFHGQNGMVEIIPSIYCKESYAYVLCLEEMLRIGSTDVTFKRPGRGDEFFRELDAYSGYELRAYSDQALFCFAPAKNVLISAIVN